MNIENPRCTRPNYGCYNCPCSCHLCRPQKRVRRYHFICFTCKNAYKQYIQYQCAFDVMGYQSPMYYMNNKYVMPQYVIACNGKDGELNQYSSQLTCSTCNHPLFIGGFNLQIPPLNKTKEWLILKRILTNLKDFFYQFFPKNYSHGHLNERMNYHWNAFRCEYMCECSYHIDPIEFRNKPIFPQKMNEIDEYMDKYIQHYCTHHLSHTKSNNYVIKLNKNQITSFNIIMNKIGKILSTKFGYDQSDMNNMKNSYQNCEKLKKYNVMDLQYLNNNNNENHIFLWYKNTTIVVQYNMYSDSNLADDQWIVHEQYEV